MSVTFEEALRQRLVKEGKLLPDTDKSLWPAPYDEATAEAACAFIFGHVWTLDEADGTDQPIEEADYLIELAHDWYEGVLTGKPTHWTKARRMLVSWFCAALELHYSGCKRTKVGIAACAFEGAGGSQGFVWRTWYLYDQLRRRNSKWNLPEPKVAGTTDKGSMELLVLSNGSSFVPLNSDPDKVQGAGCGITRVEELSIYKSPSNTWSQFRTINKGRAAKEGEPAIPGGFTYSVANVSESDEYAELIKPENAPEWWGDRLLEPGKYLKFSDGPQTTICLHYGADPLKATAEWQRQARAGIDDNFWDQQYEGIRNNITGERVITNYEPSIHCHPCHFPALGRIGIIVTGWDIGTTMSPAVTLWHIEPEKNQIHCIFEYVPDVAMAMSELAPSVSQKLDKEWPSWRAAAPMFDNQCDPAGKARSGSKDGSTAIGTARDKGWHLKPSTNDEDKRIGDTQEMFLEWIEEGTPRVVVDRDRCPRTHAALFKNYVYSDNKKIGDGRILRKPLKNKASDIADAVQYALMRCKQIIKSPPPTKTEVLSRYKRPLTNNRR